MVSLYEQDLLRIRVAANRGMDAKSNYEKLAMHRPLVDAIRFALGMLDRLRPGDETLKNTVIMARMAHKKVVMPNGRVQYLCIDRHTMDAVCARADELYGPFDDP